MVAHEQERLGPVAVSWWNELLARKREASKYGCPTCSQLMDAYLAVKPHRGDQEDEYKQDRSSKNAAVSVCLIVFC